MKGHEFLEFLDYRRNYFMKHILIMLSVAFLAATSFSGSALADGDAVKGKKVFKKCKACHKTDASGKHGVGPNLFSMFGKQAAHAEGYKYSKAMKASGLTWDEATLDTFLTKPKKMVKKTKMAFAGLKKPQQRADVIAYLKTLK